MRHHIERCPPPRPFMLAKMPRPQLPDNVGRHSKKIDTALPGKHTQRLYNALERPEAEILVQLRNGMSRLNDTSIALAPPNPTSALVDEHQRPWNISCSIASGGRRNEGDSGNKQPRKEGTCPFSLGEKLRPIRRPGLPFLLLSEPLSHSQPALTDYSTKT